MTLQTRVTLMIVTSMTLAIGRSRLASWKDLNRNAQKQVLPGSLRRWPGHISRSATGWDQPGSWATPGATRSNWRARGSP